MRELVAMAATEKPTDANKQGGSLNNDGNTERNGKSSAIS